MLTFESIPLHFQDKNLKLSLELNQPFYLLYHSDANFLNELKSYFNHQKDLVSGSIILDRTIINNLGISERQKYFYKYVSYWLNFQEFDKGLTIKKIIKDFTKLFDDQYNEKKINEMLASCGLDKVVDTKVKNLSDEQNFFLSLIISLIKAPKLLVIEDSEFLNQNKKQYIEKLNKFVELNNIQTNIIWLTHDINYADDTHAIDLTKERYYEPNNRMSIYTAKNFNTIGKIKWSTWKVYFKYLSKWIFSQQIWMILLSLLLGIILETTGVLFAHKKMDTLSNVMTYLAPIIGFVIYYALVIYPIYFKKQKFLIDLNILGMFHMWTISASIIFFTMLVVIPTVFICVVIVILYYCSSLIEFINMNTIIYPICCYLIPTIIFSFVSSIKLRINISNKK